MTSSWGNYVLCDDVIISSFRILPVHMAKLPVGSMKISSSFQPNPFRFCCFRTVPPTNIAIPTTKRTKRRRKRRRETPSTQSGERIGAFSSTYRLQKERKASSESAWTRKLLMTNDDVTNRCTIIARLRFLCGVFLFLETLCESLLDDYLGAKLSHLGGNQNPKLFCYKGREHHYMRKEREKQKKKSNIFSLSSFVFPTFQTSLLSSGLQFFFFEYQYGIYLLQWFVVCIRSRSLLRWIALRTAAGQSPKRYRRSYRRSHPTQLP